jgi:tetratricopeptide (TPR) repeat protein
MAAAKTGEHQESLATLGLADLETYRGNLVVARALLVDGIEQDIAAENQTAAAVKNIALAQTYIAAGSVAPAIAAASRAVELLRGAVELADLWLIRFELGRSYLEAGFLAEALTEFIDCDERRGEATAVFLDDMPSYRYLAALPYWTARAQQGLGMQSSSTQGYEAFLSLRPEGGPLAEDAHRRLP